MNAWLTLIIGLLLGLIVGCFMGLVLAALAEKHREKVEAQRAKVDEAINRGTRIVP